MTDIAYLPGSSETLRSAADRIRATTAGLDTARSAAARLEAILAGRAWRGRGFEAFRAAYDRKPITPAVDHAVDRMHEAATALDVFAARFDDHQDTLRWCRHRAQALAPDDPALTTVLQEALEVRERHRRNLDTLAEHFDRLDDEPTYATPPPSNFERVSGFVGDVGRGAGQGLWSLATLGFEASLYSNPVTAPAKWTEAWEQREQIVAVLQYAAANPDELALELGQAVLDWDALMEEGFGVWVGRMIPGIVIGLATAGMGRVGVGAAQAARGATRVSTAASRFARTDTVARRVATKLVDPRPVAGLVDGLLTGSPAMSTRTQGAMAGVFGVAVLDKAATPVAVAGSMRERSRR